MISISTKPDNAPHKLTWADNAAEAKKIQERLKNKIIITPLKKRPSYIAGVDAAFTDDIIIAVATLYTYPDLLHLTDVYGVKRVSFPYIPGFLSFREGHAVIKAIKELPIQPDVILFDGHGIAHPRGVGLASHMGVILGVPSIGCAKSRLVGEYKEPGLKKGSWASVLYNSKEVGVALRTRTNVKPIFVSPGHLIDTNSSIKIVMDCISNYRLPEPIRKADRISRTLKKDLITIEK